MGEARRRKLAGNIEPKTKKTATKRLSSKERKALEADVVMRTLALIGYSMSAIKSPPPKRLAASKHTGTLRGYK